MLTDFQNSFTVGLSSNV